MNVAYEYEEDNIRKVRLYNIMTGSSKKIKPINELKEVYAKARAFDEVIKIVETEFVSEDLADDIRILVNDYEYDMEDK
ncbi:hypothetical protein [Mammaliicoccus vitulinus]|uniref:hypothetical protein n=1 Tax=Mammaliicoccus vitulinus TaxID=71237 RepID=UPI001866F992|nr:hypothetical protein [Mammaliicoccus vitulinus]